VPQSGVLTGPSLKDLSPQEFQNGTLAMLQQQSALFGDIWAQRKMQCAKWDVEAKWKYGRKFENIRTAHPILWIGTTWDHVCPLQK
jgi:hypothetical protein